MPAAVAQRFAQLFRVQVLPLTDAWAERDYLLAVRMAPQSGIWWMGLGISLQADSRNAEAQESFTRAKATNSLSAELAGFVDQKLAQLRR